ncbi:GTPase regulator Nrf1 [Spiromyces aspiralis]|uniref:GTPase regulator Nrf1 n=1 Tax=Spiromyces aspiralis TaxID=68401 RepID=A0ACC1HAD2_9FUNG|nr:GTPase regulator Nrf1 [Spiromyces aspiralis]
MPSASSHYNSRNDDSQHSEAVATGISRAAASTSYGSTNNARNQTSTSALTNRQRQRSSSNAAQQQTPTADFSILKPKNFFANERTFLSWLQLAVVMGGLGLALLNFGPDHFKVHISAFVFETGSLALITYAYIQYMRRTSRLSQRDTGTYDDRILPILVVLFFIFATAINFGLTFHKKAYFPPLHTFVYDHFLLWLKHY